MAEKGFGVKDINLIGPSGTPTITSPNNLNLNANNVAISTNVSIGGTLSVTGNVSVGGTLTYEDVTSIDSVGIITARSGIDVDDFISVGSNIHLGNAGVVTATTFSGGTLQATSGTFSSNLSVVGNISGPLLNITGDTGDDGIILINSAGGTNSDFSRIRQVISDDSFRIENKASGSYQSILKGTSDRVIELHYQGAKKLETTSSGVNVTGAITVNGSALSIDPTATDVQVAYELLSTSASGAGWRITGNGIVNTVNNPDLYLIRGQKYRFINNSGGSHPFRIQSDSSTAYGTGVTNNNASSGNIDFVPRNDAPARLYYNCTNHGGMLGNIYLRGAGGNEINVGITTFSGAVRQTGNPVFIAYRTNSYNSTTSAAVLVYNDERIDVGGNYNPTNGRFTAPVTGLYEFAYAAIASNAQTVYRYDLRVNGSKPYNPLTLELRIDQNQSGEYGTNGEYVCYVNMTAGQYAQVYVHSDNTVNNVYGSSSYGYTYFRGRLIG